MRKTDSTRLVLIFFGQPSSKLIIKTGSEHGLGKQRIANVFKNQEQLLGAIEEYTGPKDTNISANFYTNCELIPDQACTLSTI